MSEEQRPTGVEVIHVDVVKMGGGGVVVTTYAETETADAYIELKLVPPDGVDPTVVEMSLGLAAELRRFLDVAFIMAGTKGGPRASMAAMQIAYRAMVQAGSDVGRELQESGGAGAGRAFLTEGKRGVKTPEGPFPSAATYHRVSTREQDPTLARAELRRAASLRELAMVEEIEEQASGARRDRPGLLRVLELASTGRITHVLVWKLDRFGRSTADTIANIETLTRAGVTFVATSQGIELGPRAGAVGRWQAHIFLAFAELERELIRERVQLGLARARANGKTLGRPRLWVDPVPLATAPTIAAAARAAGVSRGVIRRRAGLVSKNPPGEHVTDRVRYLTSIPPILLVSENISFWTPPRAWCR